MLVNHILKTSSFAVFHVYICLVGLPFDVELLDHMGVLDLYEDGTFSSHGRLGGPGFLESNALACNDLKLD